MLQRGKQQMLPEISSCAFPKALIFFSFYEGEEGISKWWKVGEEICRHKWGYCVCPFLHSRAGKLPLCARTRFPNRNRILHGPKSYFPVRIIAGEYEGATGGEKNEGVLERGGKSAVNAKVTNFLISSHSRFFFTPFPHHLFHFSRNLTLLSNSQIVDVNKSIRGGVSTNFRFLCSTPLGNILWLAALVPVTSLSLLYQTSPISHLFTRYFFPFTLSVLYIYIYMMKIVIVVRYHIICIIFYLVNFLFYLMEISFFLVVKLWY